MTPGIATDPSVARCGYGCLPRLPGMTESIFSHLYHMGPQCFLKLLYAGQLLCCMQGKQYLFLDCRFIHLERRRGGRWIGGTYKVRSLGMWLKLDTGMLVILLLFSVL